MLIIQYLSYLTILFSQAEDSTTLFIKSWNNATIASLKENIMKDKRTDLYNDRLNLRFDSTAVNNSSRIQQSLRWNFFTTVKQTFNIKTDNWTVIEVVKTGEVVRFLNYLLVYDRKGVKVINYEYVDGNWEKTGEYSDNFKMKDLQLKAVRRPYNSPDSYGNDVIVTNFRSQAVLQSEYYLYATLPEKSKVVSIIRK